jgi:hypothetical protein
MTFRRTTFLLGRSRADLWLGHAVGARLRAVACIALAVSFALAGGLAWQWLQQTLQQKQTLDALARRRGQLSTAHPSATPKSPAASARDIARHNLAVSQLNVPWSDVFDALERQARPEVALTLAEPDTKKGLLHLQAEARDIDTLLVHAQRLGADPAFGDLALQQHETNDQDPNRPARLSFDLRLPAVPGASGAGR